MTFTPDPGTLKLIVSLEPNVPGFWLVMFGSPSSLPAFMAVIASLSETVPSFGVRSSAVVVAKSVAACAEDAVNAASSAIAAAAVRARRIECAIAVGSIDSGDGARGTA